MKAIKTYESFISDYSLLKKELDDAKTKFDGSVSELFKKLKEVLVDIFERLSLYKNNFFSSPEGGKFTSENGHISDSFLDYLEWVITTHKLTKDFVNQKVSRNVFTFGTNSDINEFVLDVISTLSALKSNESVGCIVSFWASDSFPTNNRGTTGTSSIGVPDIITDNTFSMSGRILIQKRIPLSELNEDEFLSTIVDKLRSMRPMNRIKFLLAEFTLFFK